MKSCIAILLLAPALARSQAAPTWRLVEAWRKGGGIDGPYAFDGLLNMRTSSLASAPGGRLVILDAGHSRIHIYDSTGSVVRSIGREGSGPGEFRRPFGFSVAHDGRMVVMDQSNGRIVVFSAAGDYVNAMPMTRRPPMMFDIAWDGSFDSSGRLHISRAIPPKKPPAATRGPAMAGDSALATERISADFARVDSIAMCGSPIPPMQDPSRFFVRLMGTPGASVENRPPGAPPPPSIGAVPIPFTEQRSFVRDHDGLEWSPSAPGSAELLRRDGAKCASVLARVTLRGPKAPIPNAQRDSAVAAARPPEMRAVIPREYPWFHALRVDDQNRLWVEREVNGGRRFDVFSASGEPVAEVGLPTQLATDLPIVIAHNRVYGFVKNADDVPYLVAWRIVTTR